MLISAGSHSWMEPSLGAQSDALRKGLGRAYQWAHAGLLSQELLLRECLQSHRHDMLFGESKGEWLFGLVERIGAESALRERLLPALEQLSDEVDYPRLCDLGGCLARLGDDALRKILYEIVERKPIEHCPWLGEKEIIALDGESGFRFALEARIKRFGAEGWIWDGQDLMECGLTQLGENTVTRVCACLELGSGYYFDEFNQVARWNEESPFPSPQRSANREAAACKRLTPTELLDIAEFEGLFSLLHQWGKEATHDELEVIQSVLFTTNRPVMQANLLAVFSGRALATFDERLIERCRHREPRVREMAFRALENNGHPLVGQFAREGWRQCPNDCRYLRLFIKNFQPGDEDQIRDLPDGANDWGIERHCQAILEILENHPGYHCFELGLPVYAAAPCEALRFRAASLLQRMNLAPKWLWDECRFDSNRSCRIMAQTHADSARKSRITIGITTDKHSGKIPIGPEVGLRGYAV